MKKSDKNKMYETLDDLPGLNVSDARADNTIIAGLCLSLAGIGCIGYLNVVECDYPSFGTHLPTILSAICDDPIASCFGIARDSMLVAGAFYAFSEASRYFSRKKYTQKSR